MGRIFLLTGKPRTGKSTAVRNIINRIGPQHFGGFYTEEMRDDVNRVGFRCVTLNGHCEVIAHVNSKSSLRIGRYGVDVDRFEKIALDAVRDSLRLNQATVIDEIGFMQMLSAPFEQLVHEVVSGRGNVVLGTICVDSHPKIDKIKEYPGLHQYTLDESNRDAITEVVINEIINIMK